MLVRCIIKVAKRVVRYIKGTIDYGVKFQKKINLNLLGYSDSDWVGSADDMKSKFGYSFSLGSGMFSWCSKKQDIVTQSTTEAEFVAAIAASAMCEESFWRSAHESDKGN